MTSSAQWDKTVYWMVLSLRGGVVQNQTVIPLVHRDRVLVEGTQWLVAVLCVCAYSWARPFDSAGERRRRGGGSRGSFPWTICLVGRAHNKEGPRMVLVHVGYLVLPVFGSVRNRGMTRFTLLLLFFLLLFFLILTPPATFSRRFLPVNIDKDDVNRADTC